jgi:hypothetical protein
MMLILRVKTVVVVEFMAYLVIIPIVQLLDLD